MLTCKIIFWQVVVPTVTFGSEVWVMSDRDEENFLFKDMQAEGFKIFPRDHPRQLFYGLGWLRLTSYIKVKKLIFILTILRMKDDILTRKFML